MADFVGVLDRRAVSLSDLPLVASELIEAGADFPVWLIEGQMGAGKTTLVKEIVKQLKSDDLVSSPTFSLVNEYNLRNGSSVFHFDLYRIKDEGEAYDIGVYEYFESGKRCLVEWFEKIPSLLPPKNFHIRIEILEQDYRLISYQKND